MGNVINNDKDTINWNNVKTDNISDNNNKFLTDDSKLLISKLTLNIPNPVESEEISDVEKIFSKYQFLNNNNENKISNELSDTSPFISSDMYNYLMNKNKEQPNQTGGAIKEDSSTSSTSDSSPESESKSNENKKHINKKQNEEPSSKTLSSSESEKNGDNLSYVSSSAHTEKNSDSDSESSKSNNQSTTQSGGNSVSNDNNDLPPSSINTSDINMISESS